MSENPPAKMRKRRKAKNHSPKSSRRKGYTFLPTTRHMEILEEIGKNRALPLSELYRLTEEKSSYQNFSLTVCLLERMGLVGSARGKQKRKYLYLTEAGAEYTPFSAPHAESVIGLNHDVVTVHVLKKLLELKSIKSGKITTENKYYDIVPDAIIEEVGDSHKNTIGVEVELSQKSSSRVRGKFIEYEKSSKFDYALYIMSRKSVYRAYKKVLTGLIQEIQERIVLCLNPAIEEDEFNFESSDCWFNGRDRTFTELFGGRDS